MEVWRLFEIGWRRFGLMLVAQVGKILLAMNKYALMMDIEFASGGQWNASQTNLKDFTCQVKTKSDILLAIR